MIALTFPLRLILEKKKIYSHLLYLLGLIPSFSSTSWHASCQFIDPDIGPHCCSSLSSTKLVHCTQNKTFEKTKHKSNRMLASAIASCIIRIHDQTFKLGSITSGKHNTPLSFICLLMKPFFPVLADGVIRPHSGVCFSLGCIGFSICQSPLHTHRSFTRS